MIIIAEVIVSSQNVSHSAKPMNLALPCTCVRVYGCACFASENEPFLII